MKHRKRLSENSISKFSPSALFALLAFSSLSSDRCFSSDWSVAAGGAQSWNVAGNWNPSGIPNAATATADFSFGFPSSASTITLGSNIAIETFTFNNQAQVTIAGGGFHFTMSQPTVGITTATLQSHTISAPITLDSTSNAVNLQVTPNTSGSITLSGGISEAGSHGSMLTKSFPGTLTLSGTSNYTKGTNINGGKVLLASANTLPSTGTVELAWATSQAVLDLQGHNQTVGNITASFILNENIPLLLLHGATLTVGDSTTSSFDGFIGDSAGDTGKLIKQGSGTLQIGDAGVSSGCFYTGGTTVEGTGVLQAGYVGVFPPKGLVTLANTATLNLNNYDQTIGNITGPAGTTVMLGIFGGHPATLTVGDATDQTFNGVITGQPSSPPLNGIVNKIGTGKLTLTNTNLYLDGTYIQEGTVSISADANLGDPAGPITFFAPGGTLELTASVVSARDITMTGPGSILVDSGLLGSFSGDITGAGALTLSGPGDYVISGTTNNTYSGGTSITGGGALSITDYRNLGTGPLTFATTPDGELVVAANITAGNPFANPILLSTDATIAVNNTIAATFSGVISGSGLLTKINPGRLILTGTNTNSGGILIDNGVLQVSSDANLGADGNPIMIGSSLQAELDFGAGMTVNNNITLGSASALKVFAVLNPADTVTISGNISGSGTFGPFFRKGGPGTLVLTGNNTYNEGTIIAAGSLQGTTNGLQGNIQNNSNTTNALVFDQDFDGTYAGNITGSGTGNVVKTGAGAVTFTGVNSYFAPTQVLAGTLIVNGSLASEVVTVSLGATLGGVGTITSQSIGISGTLSPGNSIGIMNLSSAPAPVFQLPGSNLLIEINPTASDLVNVTGTYQIDGGVTLNVVSDPGIYTVPTSYLIVDTTTGITGTFDTVTSNAPAMHFLLDYTTGSPDELFLVLDSISFANAVTGSNATSVAGCADMSTASPGSDLSNILAGLVTQPESVLNNAFNQMQPSAFKSLIVSQQNIMLEVESALNDRYLAHYKTSCDPNYKQRRSIWLETFGSSQTQGKEHKGGSVQPAYSTKSYGILAGVDTPFGDGFSIGAVTGYTRGNLSLHDNAGHGHVQSAYLGPYAGYDNRHFYINASVLGQANWYETNRKMQFTGVDRTAYSSHMGQGALLHLGGGGWFGFNRFDISPFVNLDYIFMSEDFHSESRAGALNLRVRTSIYQFTELEGGLLMRTCAKIRQGTIIPEIRLSVIGEFRNQGEDYKSSLADTGGCYFITEGYYPNRVLFSPEAKIKALLYQDRLTASIYYQGKYGASFNQNEIGVTLAWAF